MQITGADFLHYMYTQAEKHLIFALHACPSRKALILRDLLSRSKTAARQGLAEAVIMTLRFVLIRILARLRS